MTFRLLLAAALTVVVAFLGLPVLAIFVDVPPGDLLAALDDRAATDALLLSLQTSLLALGLIVLLGTPAAWVLATRRQLPGRSVLITLIELPLVVPPAVAGVALLAALGPKGLLGGAGPDLVLQTGGVVVALTFVASPFYVRGAIAAFEGIDRGLLETSRTLGASEARTLLRVVLPTVRPALLAGGALAWGRALGEFGATLMFAGSYRGVTQTAPLAIYERFGTDFPAALALSAVLVLASAALLLTVKVATARAGG